MESLPVPVEQKLQAIVTLLDEGLQARAHNVEQAQRIDPAFQREFAAAPLQRALFCHILKDVRTHGVQIDELGNGGCEVAIAYRGVERRFRLKATKSFDFHGSPIIRVGSDSILTNVPRQPTLFDPPEFSNTSSFEQWVLAYRLHQETRTFTEVTAGRVVGTANDRPPYRLVFDDLASFDISPPLPPSFPGSEEDLDLGLEEDLGNEEAG